MQISVEMPEAKVIYIYAQGSRFEEFMNDYMSSIFTGLDPDNPSSFRGQATVANNTT